MATGIAPKVWADHDWRTIITAVDILGKRNEKEDPEGRQMSG